MSLHRKLIVSLAAASALLAGSAQAQYVGPTAGPTAPSSVAATGSVRANVPYGNTGAIIPRTAVFF